MLMEKPQRSRVISFPQITDTECDGGEDSIEYDFCGTQMSFS